MAYLCTGAALVFLTLKGFCGKKVSTYARCGGYAFLFNLIRLLFCIPIALAVVLLAGAGESLIPEGGLLVISLTAGAANAAFLTLWMLAVQKNTMVAVDVTLTMGSLLPALLSFLFFGEPLSFLGMIGFAFILTAAFILGHGEKRRKSMIGIFLLVLAALSEGVIGFSQQLFKQYYTDTGVRFAGKTYPAEIFHFYTFLFAGAFLLFAYLVFLFRGRRGESEGHTEEKAAIPWRKVLSHIAVMAACLFIANYAQTAASAVYALPSQILYPLVRGGTLILVNVTALFFGERFTRRAALGTTVALCGILLMNLL